MKLRIKNFRSLSDTGDIEIKPITILLGKNSSGKSSFIRTFPMLKQSTEERTKSPILLYGNYVDFGSYRDIKPHYINNNNESYELGFTLDKDIGGTLMRRFRIGSTRRAYYENSPFIFNYRLKFEENEKELIQINEIICCFLNSEISIKLDHKKHSSTSIAVNNRIYFKSDDNLRFIDDGGFFIQILKERKASESQTPYEKIHELIERKIVSLISKYCLKSTSYQTKWNIVSNLVLCATDEELLAKIKNIKSPKKWNDSVFKWTIETEDFISLKDLLFLFDFFSIYGYSINSYLTNIFSGIKYIAPLRATAERYYRIQHLAVDEVDPNGKNLPVFLDSLTDTQMLNFQNWTMENFSFKTRISKIEGHYSIKIIQEDKYEINLSDMGFGYSQILPIITQMWYTASRYDNRKTVLYNYKVNKPIIVIEQPELHLHPEFQAKFADAIAKVIKLTKSQNTNLSIIIETHSDVIVNRLGDCILQNEISSEDINIVIFNKPSETKPSEISIAKYDVEGNLLNWPSGFFLPSIKN